MTNMTDFEPKIKEATPPMRREDDLGKPGKNNAFIIPFLLVFVFAVIEFYTGVWGQSLALVGDAWHMFSDVFALGVAMIASFLTNRTASSEHHHDHGDSKVEIVASMINALVMLVVIGWIVYEAIERFNHPKVIVAASGVVMAIALLGLIVNLVVAKQLHAHGHDHGTHDHLNHRAAFLHVMGDILGSIAALIAGAVIFFTGWLPIDPILSIVISVLLLFSTAHLIKDIFKTHKGHAHKH